MAIMKKKVSARRQHFRKSKSEERFVRIKEFLNGSLPIALLVQAFFIIAATAILSLDTTTRDGLFENIWKPWREICALAGIVILICMGASLYIHHHQNRIVQKPSRAMALAGLFLILLALTKVGSLYPEWVYLATGSAVTSAIILTIAYDQRFALGMTLFYCIIACFAIGRIANIELFLTMMAGVVTCCFYLKEIRTRMKLIEVTTLAFSEIGQLQQ